MIDSTNTNLKIREDPAEGHYVSGLKVVKIHKVDDFRKLLNLGEKARHYRQTDIHEHSSRSHTIFRILIENRLTETRRIVLEKKLKKKVEAVENNETQTLENLEEETGQKHLSFGTKYSILNLVDLAGSERLSESGDSQI